MVEDLSPWILSKGPSVVSVEFRAWRDLSARRLLGELVNSVLSEADHVWFQVSGPPTFRIGADDTAIAASWEQLTELVKWVYLSGQDIDVRHLIFAVEFARANRSDSELKHVIAHALEGAKTTYEAHVQSASRETLKALADLRKTVIDETQKITQRAQDLTSNIWRDLTVTVAPFVIKLFSDAGNITAPRTTGFLYIGAAVFIAVSFFLQIRINKIFLDNQTKSRKRWFETLYNYISENERSDIAEDPINGAIDNYKETQYSVGLLYALLFIILIASGVSNMVQVVPAPASVIKPSVHSSATP